ncbi:hypothetical protein [Legionella sp.]|uniref:hypothetical protein n=1 Tax=Legionella sp. TaxID=459 RepID=UPI003CC51ACE
MKARKYSRVDGDLLVPTNINKALQKFLVVPSRCPPRNPAMKIISDSSVRHEVSVP